MTTTPPQPAHFADSIAQGGRTLLADEHPAWRVIGAWIATRQRGDAELIRPHAANGAGDTVVADAAALIAHGGGPMRTGAELDVEVQARPSTDGTQLMQLDIRLVGSVDDGQAHDHSHGHDHKGELTKLTSHLSITSLVREGEVWKIGALLDETSRGLLTDPAFMSFLQQQKSAGPEAK